MKIGFVQYNPVIGDFTYNCEKMLVRAEEAKASGCQLIIFPELSVSGYPPQDLLHRAVFIEEQNKALARLLKRLPAGVDVLFGCIEKSKETLGKGLYNSAFVVRDGEIVYRVRKQLLSCYDVFDEPRYFQAGESLEEQPFFECRGKKLAITICEDVWPERIEEYAVNPIQQLKNRAAADQVRLDGLINISASPFQQGKDRLRKALFHSISKELDTPFMYCNQTGGQDSLVFDGASFVLDREGRLLCQARSFEEDLLVYDDEQKPEKNRLHDYPAAEESVYKALVTGVRDYVKKSGFSQVVLGLSGGIDSALSAVIAVDALGCENVLGVALPSQYSSRDSLLDAKQLADNLGCGYEVIPIKELFASFEDSLSPIFRELPEDVTEQNLQARIRGSILMALSNKFNRLLLTTGNKSELAVGYCTLYGDMNGGLAVISDVPKQLVYDLARYVNRHAVRIPENSISKAPSAELRPNQLDQDELPPYDVLDRILEMHIEYGFGTSEIIGQGFETGIVEDIVRRVRLNEYKRKQAPMGLKVTSKAFGYGRRFPNVHNFRQ